MKSNLLKLFPKILAVAFFMAGLTVCSKKDKIISPEGPDMENPDTPDSLKIYPGRNRVKITWKASADKTVIKYTVRWTVNGKKHSEDAPLTDLLDGEAMSLLINDLPEGLMAFNVVAYNEKGNSSGISNVFCNIYGSAYEAGLTNREVGAKKFQDEVAWINWEDPGKGLIRTELNYQDNQGTLISKIIPPDSISTTLANYSRENVIQYRSVFLPEPEALDTFYTPFSKIPFYETVYDGDVYLDMELFARKIEEKFAGHVTKYSYDIRYRSAILSNAKGPNRTSSDPPASVFTVSDRFNPASVTKAITGVALLRALEKRDISFNTSIAEYLPSYWTQHPSIAGITFKEVLNHTSGIRNVQGYNSEAMERLIAKGVTAADKVYAYENVNYALARVLLVYVLGFVEQGIAGNDYQHISTAFTDYINNDLLVPVGISPTTFKPSSNGSLFYPFPAGTMKGTAYGNWTLQEGSAGIQISTTELGTFLQNLYTPGVYLSQNMISDMQTYGMALAKGPVTVHGGQVYQKSGSFPGSSNGGANLSTLLIRFGNGVQGFIMANGGEFGAGKVIMDAYNESWVPR